MKNITECGNHIMGCSQPDAYRLAFIIVFFLLGFSVTSATAQSRNETSGTTAPQTSKAFAVADDAGVSATTGKSTETEQLTKTEKGRITLYPDPVSDYLLVVLPVAVTTNTLVTVRSMDGTTVATDTIAAGATNTVIDVKQVPHGMYAVTIDNVADKQISRLVKN